MPAKDEGWGPLASLFEDLESWPSIENLKPHLAHYTTIENIEKIISSEEIWFSNPLFMNDKNELIHFLNLVIAEVEKSSKLETTIENDDVLSHFRHYFTHYVRDYDENGIMKTSIFCFTEHEEGDNDGNLAMWRGYGDEGRGAAIVLDTSKLPAVPEHPIYLVKVKYLDEIEIEQTACGLVDRFIQIVAQHPMSIENAYIYANALLQRAVFEALVHKHNGFAIENEWRAIRTPFSDHRGLLDTFESYFVGRAGPEPKLRMPISYRVSEEYPMPPLSELTDMIILGPSDNILRKHKAFQSMLSLMNKGELADKVCHSLIPFRPKF